MTQSSRNDLFLVRHAPADHGGRLCGRTDVAALIAQGPQLAALQRLIPSDSLRLSSPALRCKQTAAALWPGAVIGQDPRLWEQDFGDHDGLPFADIPDLGPQPLKVLARHRPPGGESFDDMTRRLRPALHDLARHAASTGPVAVVAHAGTVRAALGIALDQPYLGLAFDVQPLSVTRLRSLDQGFAILSVNWLAA
ncbi:MAG: histidine phosphatase family protein [Paracoccaceae bacterium]